MRRRLFTIPAALSLLLCVAVLVQMVRSYDAPQTRAFTFKGELWEVIWDRGEVRLDNELEQSLELQRRQSALLAYQDPRDRLDLRNSQELWAADELTLGRLRPDRQSKAEREKLLARLLQKPGGEERIAVLQKPVTRHRTYAHPATNLVLILGTLVLPALWLVRTGRAIKSRRERKRKGLCLSCGYDLRVSPERCPECGAVPAKD
jgi:hypothetical protein